MRANAKYAPRRIEAYGRRTKDQRTSPAERKSAPEAKHRRAARAVEKLEASREEAVQKTLHASQEEITQLRTAVSAMRDQLEKTCYEKDCAAQEDMSAAGNREKQLTNTIAALRNELERRDITHQRDMETITRTHHDEAAQLRRTIQVLRDRLESLHHSSTAKAEPHEKPSE